MLRSSLKLIECFIFCIMTTGAGNYFSVHYQLGQPWVWVALNVLILFPFALLSRKKIVLNRVIIALFICSFAYLLSFFSDLEHINGLSLYVMPLIGFAYLLVVSLQSQSRLLVLCLYIKISLVILCCSIILEPIFIFREFGFLSQNIRPSGLGMNPNRTSFMMLAHLLAIIMLEGKISNRLFIFCSLFFLLTLSRSGILGLLIFFIVINLKHISIKSISFVVFSSLLTFFILSIFISNYSLNEDYALIIEKFNFGRINPFAQSDAFQQDNTRVDIITGYLTGINDKPFLGHGAETGMSGLPVSGSSIPLRAHNTFLNIWFETGIVGALSYIVFLFSIMGLGIKRTSTLLVTLICLLFTFTINNLLIQSQFWLFMGCLFSRRTLAKESLS